MAIPLIIDTDPGLDDALAILAALASEKIDLLGLTIVAGNTTLENATQNALQILDVADRRVPVFPGADRPLKASPKRAVSIHGKTGLGNLRLPQPRCKPSSKRASHFIKEMAKERAGELELLAIGPLTNIAELLRRSPEVKDWICAITLMGGSVGEGNVTPSAEFNIYADPHAADLVFRSGIPITMVGLDATKKAYITRQEVDEIYTTQGSVMAFIRKIFGVMSTEDLAEGVSGILLHDPLAILGRLYPTLLATPHRPACISVTTEGKERGKTTLHSTALKGEEAHTTVALGVKREIFLKQLASLHRRCNLASEARSSESGT